MPRHDLTGIVGTTVVHYRIDRLIGRGGMGVVYKAHDLELDRDVALKFLTSQAGASDLPGGQLSRDRFLREARAASALDHPNIATVHGIHHTAEGEDFIAMAFYEGESLAAKLSRGPMPADAALAVLRQVANGLAAAHAASILHCDIKPANILVAPDETAKIIDFGLAKLDQATRLTGAGAFAGTVAYMAPEQVRGEAASPASDVWALGATAFEMLTGVPPFKGDMVASVVHAIVNSPIGPELDARADVPATLKAIVRKALAKDPAERYPNAGAMHAALVEAASVSTPAARRGGSRAMLLAVAFVVVGLAAGGWWLWKTTTDRAWVRAEAIPEIGRLADQEAYEGAAAILARATRISPDDPQLAALRPRVEAEASIDVDPPGARVFVKDYSDAASEWRDLGAAPIKNVGLPRGLKRWRIELAGFTTIERAAPPGRLSLTLTSDGTIPAGMVAIPAGQAQAWIAGMDPIEATPLTAYFIDRHEVTNRQFLQFIESGGYRNRAFWKIPFERDGKPISWDDGMRLFVDATGRPGPSTWELGRYPAGQDDYPVSGVSWFEAAAYAEANGKALPTVVHWVNAASTWMAPIVLQSNFGTKGMSAVGRYQGMSASGLYDVAGNVREWLWNTNGGRERHLLGGAWNDPSYLFSFAGTRPPLDRSAGNGFRCALYPSGVSAGALGPKPMSFRDFTKESPVSDAVHRAHLNLFSYDAKPLDAKTESTSDATDWRRETVSFSAAYGGERVRAHVYLPKTGRPPYQTVVYFPGSNSINEKQSASTRWPEFLAQSGRVVVYPVYKGTFERNDGLQSTWPSLTHRHKDYVIKQVQDFKRTVDYLETRPDIDANKLAYYGFSWGGRMAAIIPAVDTRVRLNIVILGGLAAAHTFPEVDQINYLSHVNVPVLMINGRHDAIEPIENAQLPMFRRWGTPDADRKHVVFETGHGPFPQNAFVKEVLDFLDRYFGAAR